MAPPGGGIGGASSTAAAEVGGPSCSADGRRGELLACGTGGEVFDRVVASTELLVTGPVPGTPGRMDRPAASPFKAGMEATFLYFNLGQMMELEIDIPIWWMYLSFPVGFIILASFSLELTVQAIYDLKQKKTKGV